MKLIILVALALVAAVVAEESPVKIIRSEHKQEPEGSYAFGFETQDGVVRGETGEVKEVLNEENKPQKVVVVRGSYSYTNVDGKPESITYYADETGYHAEGESVPKVVEP